MTRQQLAVIWFRDIYPPNGGTNVPGQIAFLEYNEGETSEVRMAVRTWETWRTQFCEHAGKEVRLEAEVTYPATWMPEQAPRVLAHRCSAALECNLTSKVACVWAGTNPAYNPLMGGR